MKKHQKTPAVNNQEMEDFEVYTLYPENATTHYNEKPRDKDPSSYSSEPAYKIRLQTINIHPEHSSIQSENECI